MRFLQLLLAVSVLTCQCAWAIPVSYTFTGLGTTDPNVRATEYMHTPFSLLLEYDTACAVLTYHDSNRAFYAISGTRMVLSFMDRQISWSPNFMEVINNQLMSGDIFSLHGFVNEPNDTRLSFGISLWDVSEQELSDMTIPTAFDDGWYSDGRNNDFVDYRLWRDLPYPQDDYVLDSFQGYITHAATNEPVIPEPATICLFLMGLGGLGALVKRGRG